MSNIKKYFSHDYKIDITFKNKYATLNIDKNKVDICMMIKQIQEEIGTSSSHKNLNFKNDNHTIIISIKLQYFDLQKFYLFLLKIINVIETIDGLYDEPYNIFGEDITAFISNDYFCDLP